MLKGKTALVTGSTSGIGLGIAQALAAQGANVLLNGFGDAQGAQAQVAAAGQAHGIAVDYHGADMSRPDEIEAMMAFGAQRFGRIDILVNNAGIQHVAKVEDFPVDKWDAILAINLSSAFHTSRLVELGAALGIRTIVIALPAATPERLRELMQRLGQAGVPTKILTRLVDLGDDKASDKSVLRDASAKSSSKTCSAGRRCRRGSTCSRAACAARGCW